MRNRTSSQFRASFGVTAALVAGLLWPAEVSGAPSAHFSRTSVLFGYVSRGVASPVEPVFVTNAGDADLVIASLVISGTQAGDFLLGGTCAPQTPLRPNDRCRIDVVMQPVTPPGRNVGATLTVQSNAASPSTDIALSGHVDPVLTGPTILPSPEWLDFAAQPVQSASPPLTLVVTNATPLTLSLQQFALVGGDAGDFSMTSDCAPPQSVVRNQSCTATIVFTPQVPGPRSTELAVQMSYQSADSFIRYSITGFGGAGGASKVTVAEYYNAALDHYFITWLPAEQQNLDAGNTPTRWNRTGQSFQAYLGAAAGASPVCRFYLPPQFGDSHFFGRGISECNATGQQYPAFMLEEPAFMHVVLPIAGMCPSGTTPVYRVFSNRPDANHRYMVDRAIRDQMVGRGWLAEGDGPDLVVMCAP